MSGRNGTKTVTDPVTGIVKAVPRKSEPRKNIVFRRLESSVPRAEWLAAFDASGDERAQNLMMRMMDPTIGKRTLPQLAKEVGLTYPQVLKLITQYRLDQGLLRMSAHVPQVLDDVGVDAQSKLVPCPTCQGDKVLRTMDRKTGEVLDEKPCWCCDGTGKLRKVGDNDARKLMFESLKLTGNKSPLVAQQFINAGGQSPEDALETVSQVLNVKVEPSGPAGNQS
jgi:hypothetical protein